MQPEDPYNSPNNHAPFLAHREPTPPPYAQPQTVPRQYRQGPAMQYGQPAQPTYQQPPYPPQNQPAYQTPMSAPVTPAGDPLQQDPNLQNVTQYPVDYLNQIAAPAPVKKLSSKFIFGLIAGVLLIAGIGMAVLVKAMAPPNVSTQAYALSARLDTLTAVVSEQTPRLSQNELLSINGTMGATLKSMSSGLNTYMDSKGMKDSKAKAAATKKEAAYKADLSQKLEDAYLTGTLNSTYTTEMTYQLTILKSMMQKMKSAANSKAFTTFYDNNVTSLDVVTEQLSKFQNTK